MKAQVALMLALCLWGWVVPVRAQQAAPAGDELVVAVYLPGVYFGQLSGKLELGKELAAHLQHSLGRPVMSRVYATAADLENDGRVNLALVEAPYVAAKLPGVIPVSVAVLGGKDETRMVIMGGPGLKEMSDLRTHRLAFSAPGEGGGATAQAFLESFVLEGEMALQRELLEPGRDAASALSKIALRRADAALLYEGDQAEGQQAGLRVLYESAPMPRPTLVAFPPSGERGLSPQLVQQVREAMSRFRGTAHPQIQAFRSAVADRYLVLRTHIQHRASRLPPPLELWKDEPAPRLPAAPAAVLPLPPLKLYAPDLSALTAATAAQH